MAPTREEDYVDDRRCTSIGRRVKRMAASCVAINFDVISLVKIARNHCMFVVYIYFDWSLMWINVNCYYTEPGVVPVAFLLVRLHMCST